MQLSDLEVTVSLDALSRVLGAASEEKTRYYLNGVSISRRRKADGVLLCATDGHMLALENDEFGSTNATPETHAILHRDAVTDIVRVAKLVHKKEFATHALSVSISKNRFTFIKQVSGGMHSDLYPFTCSPVFIEGVFPDFERVIPRFEDDKPSKLEDASFDARRVLTLAETAKSDRRSPIVFKLWQQDQTSPAVMRVAGAPNWLGVLMPIMFGPNDANANAKRPTSDVALPQWLR